MADASIWQSTVMMSVNRSVMDTIGVSSSVNIDSSSTATTDDDTVRCPTGMAESRRKAADRSTTLIGDLRRFVEGILGRSSDRLILRRSMILRKEISCGVRVSLTTGEESKVGLASFGEEDSLGIRNGWTGDEAAIGSDTALSRGMVNGWASADWLRWKLVKSDSFENVVFGAEETAGNFGVSPILGKTNAV